MTTKDTKRSMGLFLRGGLGNQLFQLAYALSNTNFDVDRISLILMTKRAKVARDFALGDFGVGCRPPTKVEKLLYWGLMLASRADLDLSRLMVATDKNFKQLQGTPRFALGYFQDQSILHQNREMFLRFLRIEALRTSYGSSLKQECEVAVHIRRGDYFNNRETASIHAVCTPSWYERCMKDFMDTGNFQFVIFSDDPEWAEKTFCGPNISIAASNRTPLEDIVEMTTFRNFILSNSSFSFWAQFLSQRREKVIAPSHWYRGVETRHLAIYDPYWELKDVTI